MKRRIQKRVRKPTAVAMRILIAVIVATVSLAMLPTLSYGAGPTFKATGSDRWSPASKTVSKGTRVAWKNASDDEHNLVSYKGSWSKNEDLSEGEKTSYTFTKSGTYRFRCSLHSKLEGDKCSGMCGKVKVK